MARLTTIGLKTTLPDDRVVEDDGHVMVVGGQGVAIALTTLLRHSGAETGWLSLDPTEGWILAATKDGWGYDLRVSDRVDLLQVKVSKHAWFRGAKPFRTFLDDLYQLLADDPRFHDIQWIA